MLAKKPTYRLAADQGARCPLTDDAKPLVGDDGPVVDFGPFYEGDDNYEPPMIKEDTEIAEDE